MGWGEAAAAGLAPALFSECPKGSGFLNTLPSIHSFILVRPTRSNPSVPSSEPDSPSDEFPQNDRAHGTRSTPLAAARERTGTIPGNEGAGYLRMPRLGLFNCCWRFLVFLRLGLWMMNVPEPMYSAW